MKAFAKILPLAEADDLAAAKDLVKQILASN